MKSLLQIALLATTLSITAPLGAEENSPPPQVLFTNVNVFDGVSQSLIKNASVLVEGKLIKTVSTGSLSAPAATVIDGSGRTLMPGLIDAHVHLNMQFGGYGTDRGIQGMQNMTWEEIGALAYESAREYLPAGVTTVRDLCGMSQGLRKHIDSGTLEGPRIYTSGTCLGQSSGHGDWRWDPSVLRDDGSKSNLELLGITKLTDGADAVLGASRNNLAGGADFVKMMSGGGVTSERDPIESVQGTIEELSAMVTATSQFGTMSAVHAYHDESVRNALKAGVVSIEHGNLMAEAETFEMVKEADAWVVPAMAAFAEDIFDHPYYGNPDLPAYAKVQKIIVNAENWIDLANKYEINLGFGSDSVITT